MTKRIILHTPSKLAAWLSLHSSHRSTSQPRPSPRLQLELQHHPLFTSVITANRLSVFLHLVYPHTPSPYTCSSSYKSSDIKLSKHNKAGWLDFFVGVFCNLNPSAIFTMKHRALAHNCYHTAIGG